MNNLSSSPGTYLLLLNSQRTAELTVGRLGSLTTEPGYYLYVGSAFGTGGLQARIAHHARQAARPHWHIDYLRAVTRLETAWYNDACRCEHDWAHALMHSEGIVAPMSGFGASDCSCFSHLFYAATRPVRDALEKTLDSRLSVVDVAAP